jgi:hypothetical protein
MPLHGLSRRHWNAGGGFGLYQRIARRVTGYDQLSFTANV